MIDIIKKPVIFITGAPRSGTSLITKVIDSHPDIAVMMESILDNRRRHWMRSDIWGSSKTLCREVSRIYENIKEPILGNKVCTPDVWSAEDIVMFCKIFMDFKVVFIVRDPIQVALSRLRRENFEEQFNAEARSNLLLNFKNRFLTYTSSWRQSVENYWKMKDAFGSKVSIVYYEDLCNDFDSQVRSLCSFLDVPFSDMLGKWHELPHHDAYGELQSDLKYKDAPVFYREPTIQQLPEELQTAITTIQWQYELFQKKLL